jgi:hypothetical protein
MRLFYISLIVLTLNISACSLMPRLNSYDTKWVTDSLILENKNIEITHSARCKFAYVKEDVKDASFKNGACYITNMGFVFKDVVKNGPSYSNSFNLGSTSKFIYSDLVSLSYIDINKNFIAMPSKRVQMQMRTSKGIIVVYFLFEDKLHGYDVEMTKRFYNELYNKKINVIDNATEIPETYVPDIFICCSKL